MNENIDTVMVQRGHMKLGVWEVKADGSKEGELCKWIPTPEGTAILVCPVDTETHEQRGEADVFPIWDSVGIDKDIRKKLALTKRNFPTPEEWYRWIKEWEDRNIDICDICQGVFSGYDCGVCPIEAIKYIAEGNED